MGHATGKRHGTKPAISSGYGLVATNEFEHAWMDEGFNTYSTARVLDAAYPGRFVGVSRYFGGLMSWSYPDVRWLRAIDGNRLNPYRPVAAYDVQSTPTWRYWPGSASAITYNKTALWLATLERMLGWETTQRILSTHFARGAFKHPTPDSFLQSPTKRRPGSDLVLDAAPTSAISTMAAPTVGRSAARMDFSHQSSFSRYADGVFDPTRITFADGSRRDERWMDATCIASTSRCVRHCGRWRSIRPRAAVDVNYTNNSGARSRAAPKPRATWAAMADMGAGVGAELCLLRLTRWPR